MSPLKSSNPNTADTEYSNILAEGQEKNLKTACVNMIELCKKEMNKFLK